MDAPSNHKYGPNLQRHLAPIKLVSRLLGHELHSQGGSKAIALSREQVTEIQTALDLFIEEASRRAGGAGSGYGAGSGSGYSSSSGSGSSSGDSGSGSYSTGAGEITSPIDTQLVPARN